MLNPDERLNLYYEKSNDKIETGVSCVRGDDKNTTYFVIHYATEGTCPEVINIPVNFLIRKYNE